MKKKEAMNWKAAYHRAEAEISGLEARYAAAERCAQERAKLISTQEGALRGQEATIRDRIKDREQTDFLIVDNIKQIEALNRRVMELAADARASEHQTALMRAKYQAALEIIKVIISEKETLYNV